jgi:GDPmannose 4,6-dehydratase
VFEANLGTGIAHSIADWAKACFDAVNRDWREFIVPKTGFTTDYSRLVANPSRIRALGWQPKTDLLELARLMAGELPDAS